MSDIKELARQAANGDKKAFESLYEQTNSGVWFTCMGLLRNEENAKDIMQDTYLTLFEKLPALTNLDGIQGWLNKVAANKCRDYLRSSSNRLTVDESEEIIENIPDDALFPEEYVMDKAKRAIIMDIIQNKLSEVQSRTIILYYFDELTVAEIAELTDCHEKTVLYRLKTARLKIKEEVMRYEEENKDKLYAFVPIPLLTLLLRAEAEHTLVPQNIVSFEKTFPNPQNALDNSAATAANTGGKTMLNALKAKIIAGACAAAVVGGGVTAGVVISNNSKNKTESNPTYSASANVSKPANTSNPTVQSTPEDSKVTSAGGTASATTSGAMVEGDYEYMPMKHRGEVDDSAVMITKYNGPGGDVIIPSTLGGKPVKSIKDAFYQCKNVTEVTIPEGVLYIERMSFKYCEALKTINFPSTLQEIGNNAFEECDSLETVTLPENLVKVDYEAFMSCDSLKTVYLNDNLHVLGTKLIRFSFNAEVIYKGQAYNVDTFDELIETYFNGDPLMPGR